MASDDTTCEHHYPTQKLELEASEQRPKVVCLDFDAFNAHSVF
ncbi:hypothetical protein [Bradyrhizobium ontarionense]|nr:hypothetical protein [Bradyrhizobium sp. A19]